ncbi:MAG TPA: amidohydrolase family protein [Chthoniobacterales bacterium]|nr:amidohydrolase family protein [Chthoniobacterales bacterium]
MKRALAGGGRLHLLAIVAFSLRLTAGAESEPAVTVIENVTVVSPERAVPLTGATVVLRADRIVAIGKDVEPPPGATRIEAAGRFLTPGLIDSHVHIGNMGPLSDDALGAHPELLEAYRAQLPRSYLAFGFTTLIDLDLRESTLAWFKAAPMRPDLCHCGRGVRIPGGYGALRPIKDAAAATAANIIHDPGHAESWPENLDRRDYSPRRAVERVVKAGAICLKTFIEPGFGGAADWPVPTAGALDDLRAAAKREGLAFVVHANAVESWRTASDARADVIAHGLWHWRGDQLDANPTGEVREAIRAAARAGVRVQPTLQAVYGDLSIFDKAILDDSRLTEALPGVVLTYLRTEEGKGAHEAMANEYKQAIAKLFASESLDPLKAMSVAPARASATLRLMRAENVRLLFGTDTPSNEGIGNPPGLNGRLEMTRWLEAGVSLSEILRAATLENAETFGLCADVGTIEVGKRANLLLLRADPLQTITAYDQIETVFVHGNAIPRKSLLPEKWAAGEPAES